MRSALTGNQPAALAASRGNVSVSPIGNPPAASAAARGKVSGLR